MAHDGRFNHTLRVLPNNDDVGLIYMNARYYVPNTNRMASPDSIVPDPANPQSFNRYSYVNNRPLNFTDPTGHCAFAQLPDGTETDEIVKFDCTVGEFQALSWEQREKWIQSFVELYGLGEWFDDILGAIGFLSSDPDYSRGGGWAAYMDAGILQAINDGMRLYKGQNAIGSGTSHGGGAWHAFFIGYLDDDLEGRDLNQLIVLRLAGEQGGVDYARSLSETQRRFTNESARVQNKVDLFLWGADNYRSFGMRCRSNYSCQFDLTDPRAATETWLVSQILAPAPDWVSWMVEGLNVAHDNPYYMVP